MPELRLNLITEEWVIIDRDKCKKQVQALRSAPVSTRILWCRN